MGVPDSVALYTMSIAQRLYSALPAISPSSPPNPAPSECGTIQFMGQTKVYSDEARQALLSRLESGETLNSICKEKDQPSIKTVMEWVALDAEWGEKYARARSAGLDAMADQILEIADDGSRDYSGFRDDGSPIVDQDHIQRSKLRVDSRRWLLSKLRPEKYGDRLAHQMLDENGRPAKAGITIIVDGAPSE